MPMAETSFNPYECYVVIASGYRKGLTSVVLSAIQQRSNNAFKYFLLLEEPGITPELENIKKQTERKIILIPHIGDVAYNVIRYLCDDCDLPPAQRRVQWIHCFGKGFTDMKFQEIPQVLSGIPVTNASAVQSKPIAEYCMYSMLYFSRKTWQHQQNLAEHKWEPYNITELYGRKVVIFGYGDIGREAAKRALAFEMEVTGVKRSRPDTDVDDLGVRVLCGEDNNDDVLRDADFVINCMPGTNFNVDFFNKERFALMKSSAVYINVGRGTSNNEEDLIEALNSGVIRGAAVDVFKVEPLPVDHPLWQVSADKLLLSSHNSGGTSNQVELIAYRFADLGAIAARGESIDKFNINKEFLY